jgi:hypothetical protein
MASFRMLANLFAGKMIDLSGRKIIMIIGSFVCVMSLSTLTLLIHY